MILQFGQSVSYRTDSGIETKKIIGWDKLYIYTTFIHPKDQETQHPHWSDDFYLMNVTRSFRIGFHRSRLIKEKSTQLELF